MKIGGAKKSSSFVWTLVVKNKMKKENPAMGPMGPYDGPYAPLWVLMDPMGLL